MKIELKNLMKFPGITQSARVSNEGNFLTLGGSMIPGRFSSSYSSSFGSSDLYELGTGGFDPEKTTRLIVHQARARGVSVGAHIESFTQYLETTMYSSTVGTAVIASIAGRIDGTVPTNRFARQTPTYLLKVITKEAPHPNEIFRRVVVDIICHKLAPFGWIMNDKAYSVRLERGPLFPDFHSMVDSVIALRLYRTLKTLADQDMTLLAKANTPATDENRALSVPLVASHLSSQFVQAMQSVRGMVDPHEVVGAVLRSVVLYYHTDSNTDGLSSRVRENGHFHTLVTNLSIFLAAQRYAASPLMANRSYFTDEEMVNYVLPSFIEAMNEYSPFVLRSLGDTVSFLSLDTARDMRQQPYQLFLSESWDISSETVAFKPVRHTRDSSGRYLLVQDDASNRLTDVVKAVQSSITLRHVVEGQIRVAEAQAVRTQLTPHDGSMTLVMPSVITRRLHTLTGAQQTEEKESGELVFLDPVYDGVSTTLSAISSEQPINNIDVGVDSVQILRRELEHDLYSILMHLAVHVNGGVVDVTVHKDGVKGKANASAVGTPVIHWTKQTGLKVPFGPSAVHAGVVRTSEPLEVLCYSDEIVAAKPLTFSTPDLRKHESNIHLWGWRNGSRLFDRAISYETAIAGRELSVPVQSHEMIGLAQKLHHVYFMPPVFAASMIQEWWTNMVANRESMRKLASVKGADTVYINTIRGQSDAEVMGLISILESIGRTEAGRNISNYIRSRLADQLRDAGRVDSYSDLMVGVESMRLAVFAGLTQLYMTHMISEEIAGEVVKLINDSGALAWRVASSTQA